MLVNNRADIPAYRRVADSIIREIATGRKAAGERLPTVRQLSRLAGVSHGTAKHVYDVLEREGYVLKAQGSGTYVRTQGGRDEGAKPKALAAIDKLLDDMRELGFSLQDTRIFLDLKLREREGEGGGVRVSAVDCSPEALAMMREQIAALEHSEVSAFLLAPVLQSPLPFDPGADIVATTSTHVSELAQKMAGGEKPVSLAMSIGAETAVELAGIGEGAGVGVLCKSERFAGNILASCAKYCKLSAPPRVALFGDTCAVHEVAQSADVLVLAPNYRLFCKGAERRAVDEALARKRQVLYYYKVEQGSLLYLQNLIESIRRERSGGLV